MTATEAEQNRRKGLTPWWRTRSWGRDLDALTRLHKGLLALDTSGDAAPQPLSAPTLLAVEPGEADPADDHEGLAQDPDGLTPDEPAQGGTAPASTALASTAPASTASDDAASDDAAPDEAPDEAGPDEGAASQDPGTDDVVPVAPSGRLPLRRGEAPSAVAELDHDLQPEITAGPPEAGNGQAETGTAQAEAGTGQGEAGTGQGEAGTAQAGTGTEQGETATEQGETDTARHADGQAGAEVDPAIAAIKETFRYVAEAGDNAIGYFYGQLFARQPRLRDLFPPAMDQQRDRLFHALGRIVESLSTPEEMAAYLSQLGRDHRKYRVEPQMYEVVGAALLATLRSFAKDAFTAEAEEAWTQVYAAGSSLMIKAAEEDTASGPAAWTAEVVHVDHRTENIAVLTIAPDEPLLFTAGQHLTVQTPRWPRVWRPYSIASRPRDDGLLTLHVKAIPGGWVSTALVRHTPPGTEILLGPPLGTMTMDHAGGRDLLCVAGGTGLAPVKAIIEQAVRESATTPRRIYLFYGARQRAELYDLPDLWRLEDAYQGFQLIPVTSDDPAFDGMQGNVGRVAARYMPHTDCEAYVAGPPEMVRETIRVLGKAGLEPSQIHFDDALLAGRSWPAS